LEIALNLARFLKKCFTDRAAAAASAKLVLRQFYGQLYWTLWPDQPLTYRLPKGGKLLLTRGHSFTHCFWPGVERYEPDVREALHYLLKPGQTFVDCGANVGYFSVMALGLVGPTGSVVSVEANPTTFELLRANLAANGRGAPVHRALTSDSGEIEIFVSDAGDVYSSLKKGGLVTGASVKSHRVRGQSLDSLVSDLKLDRVDVVKIDIEGAEMDVLRSAEVVMREFRPAFVVEYGVNTWPAFGATAEEFRALAAERDYEIKLYDPETDRPVDPGSEAWASGYINFLLLPREMMDRQSRRPSSL
jgi:FkbM family methyltransferase